MPPGRSLVWGVRDATGRKGAPPGGTEVLHGVLESWRGERDLHGRAGGGTWERVVTHQISTFIKRRKKKKKTTGSQVSHCPGREVQIHKRKHRECFLPCRIEIGAVGVQLWTLTHEAQSAAVHGNVRFSPSQTSGWSSSPTKGLSSPGIQAPASQYGFPKRNHPAPWSNGSFRAAAGKEGN